MNQRTLTLTLTDDALGLSIKSTIFIGPGQPLSEIRVEEAIEELQAMLGIAQNAAPKDTMERPRCPICARITKGYAATMVAAPFQRNEVCQCKDPDPDPNATVWPCQQ